MPVSVIVGGQFGSEGKGKVALMVARQSNVSAVVRVGGPNSGHTGIDKSGRAFILRQLPAASLHGNSFIVLPAGSLIDVAILANEIAETGIDPRRVVIDGLATVVPDTHRLAEEEAARLTERLGSTASGTGAALIERLSRSQGHVLARDVPELANYVRPFVAQLLRDLLVNGKRIVIEGTQGFGLSVWHSPHYPYATSRDTTAATFVGEAEVAPHDVDDVVLVIRSYPIRVGGNSGPLPNELSWETLASLANLPDGYHELSSATRRRRRVAQLIPRS